VTEDLVPLPRAGTRDFDLAWRRELRLKLRLRGGGEDPSWDDLSRRLRDHPGRMLFTAMFATSDWEQDGPARIEALLRAWERCGDVPAADAPLVCVQVVYEPRSVSLLRRWLGGDANARLHAYLDALASVLEAGATYPKVQAVRLRHLDDVRPVHLLSWQRLEPARTFSREADFSDKIEELFRAPEAAGHDDGLPMNRVVPQLRRWLESST
jgi:hypothetical protein